MGYINKNNNDLYSQIFLKDRNLYFPASDPLLVSRPWRWPPTLAPNFYLTALAPNLCLRPWLQICFYWSWPQIILYRPWSVRSLGLHTPTSSPQFAFTGPGLQFLLPSPEFAFTFLSIVVAVAVVILAIVLIS